MQTSSPNSNSNWLPRKISLSLWATKTAIISTLWRKIKLKNKEKSKIKLKSLATTTRGVGGHQFPRWKRKPFFSILGKIQKDTIDWVFACTITKSRLQRRMRGGAVASSFQIPISASNSLPDFTQTRDYESKRTHLENRLESRQTPFRMPRVNSL